MFLDRADAGRRLAKRLDYLRGENIIVLGLPRGGVPVAFEIANALNAPLDVIMVRKLGVPFQPELAMGAVGEGGIRVVNKHVIRQTQVTEAELAAVQARAQAELQARAQRFRGVRPRPSLVGRTAVIVDDGIATGATMRAACQVVQAQGATRVLVAVPVGAPDAVQRLRANADEVICLATPSWFSAVGQWYAEFSQVSDAEVAALLAPEPTKPEPPPDPPIRSEDIEVAAGDIILVGTLSVPERTKGLILFSHGSGSSRHSPRNLFVANVLNEANFATLLLDLLTPEEERYRNNVFNVELLANRLHRATRQFRDDYSWIGYFGASTGAAAALWAAGEPNANIAALISRGGRPDLAWDRLELVNAPTLLIVGGQDSAVLDLNRLAKAQLRCPSELAVISNATHLFEEPGALLAVAELARDWFSRVTTSS